MGGRQRPFDIAPECARRVGRQNGNLCAHFLPITVFPVPYHRLPRSGGEQKDKQRHAQ